MSAGVDDYSVVPSFNDDSSLLQAVKDFAVEQFVAKLAIEAFAIAVFPRTAGCDEQSFRPELGEPVSDDLGGHFRAIVGTDVRGGALF